MIPSIIFMVCLLGELVYSIKESGKSVKVSPVYSFIRFIVYVGVAAFAGMFDWL